MSKKKNKKKESKEQAEKPINEVIQEESSKEPPFKYDEYWLKWAKTSIDQTIPVLHKRIQLFYNYINILSASTLVGSTVLMTLTGTKDPLVFGLVFIAIIILQIGKYLIGINASKADYENIDLRSPIQINNAHNDIVTSLKDKLDKGRIVIFWVSLVYIILVGFALFRNNKIKTSKSTEPSIAISSQQIQVNGLFNEDKDLKLLLIGYKTELKFKDTIINDEKRIDTTKTEKLDTIISSIKALKEIPIVYHYHIKDLDVKLKKVALFYKEHKTVKMIEIAVKKE